MEFVRKTVRWIQALGRWAMQAQRAWMPVLVVAGILGLGSLLPVSLEGWLRYCGLALELLGIAAVVLGITSKRRLFGRPSLLQHVRNWLIMRPRWGIKQQTIIVTGTGSLELAGSAKVSMWRGAGTSASLEDRMAAAEANLTTLKTELEEVAEQVRREAKARADAVDAEHRAREAAVGDLRAQLEGLGAEGLHVEMAGVFWLVLGAVLATIPEELTGVLNWARCWVWR
jgi:hypothetical protein